MSYDKLTPENLDKINAMMQYKYDSTNRMYAEITTKICVTAVIIYIIHTIYNSMNPHLQIQRHQIQRQMLQQPITYTKPVPRLRYPGF
jgi:hypothetical protein